MALIATYAQVDNVKRILRAVPPRGRIKFSDSYTQLMRQRDNTGTVELLRVGIHKQYSDIANFNIIFNSDSTSFKMYRVDDEKQSNFIIGQGLKQNDFTSDDGFFSIDATNWIGWSFAADAIIFSTDSHISENDGTRFLQDAELFVDSVIEKNVRFPSITESSLRFPLDSTSPIPKSIQLATQYIASYMIFKSIFLENNLSQDYDRFKNIWLKEGLDAICSYVNKWNLALSTSAPVLGHAGTNQPANLDDDFVYKSSQFNLRIPFNINYNYAGLNDYVDQRAKDFVGSNSFQQSILSDINLLVNRPPY